MFYIKSEILDPKFFIFFSFADNICFSEKLYPINNNNNNNTDKGRNVLTDSVCIIDVLLIKKKNFET